MRLGSFGTDLSHLVHFRGKSKFSILVGFWHLSRVRGLFLCDDGLQALWQTVEQGPAAAEEVVWNLFYAQNVRLGTFGTDLDRLVHFRDELNFSILESQGGYRAGWPSRSE